MKTQSVASAADPPVAERTQAAQQANLGPYVPRLLTAERAANGPTHWASDGTLLIADVSGFTRLTERLSRQGNMGAEEIVNTISAVFTALLSAETDGGDVLKFSGDGLVLFFDGPAHAQRGIRAALAMQGTLRQVGGIDSSIGRVRLRMTVGAHTGRFHFFLCGADHLELFVLGESASAAVTLQRAAGQGEVLVDEATARLLPAGTRVAGRPDGIAVRAMPPLPPYAHAEQAPEAGIERFIPPQLRGRLAADDGEHEHRRATVAFASFKGTDDLLRNRGPEEVFQRVQALTTVTMAALQEYGVLLTATDLARDGGIFMLTAGAPETTGEEEARMLRVTSGMAETDCGLAVRAGVNAGNVFVGIVGAPFRRTYSTMGAAANVAARVMTAAEWGQVLATGAVADRVRGRFTLQPVAAFTVKGIRRPVEAYAVGAAVDATASDGDAAATPESSIPLVDRAAEMEALTQVLERVRAGAGQIVEIVGEPGVGKSRLVHELRKRAAGPGWIEVKCAPYERTSPYATARLLLRRVLGLAPSASAEEAGVSLRRIAAEAAPHVLPWLPLAAVPLGAAVEPTPQTDLIAGRYRRIRIHDVTCGLVAAVVNAPTVMALEDVDHMDDASADLVAALFARVLPTRPWLAVLTRRQGPQGLHPGRGYGSQQLQLGPLDPSAAVELARKLAERMPVPAHLLPQLVERAAGNPLFLSELVAAQSAGSPALPRSVEDIIAARIDLLEPRDRRALRYLSVMGDRFDVDLLDEVLGPLGIDSRQVEQWRRLHPFIVRDHDGFSFRTALVRQAAYEGLSYQRRRQLHSRVADALLRRSGEAAQLPLHLVWAQRWAEAWSTAIDAADRALGAAANAVAGELYELALTAARHLALPGDEVARVAERAGEVWERAGMWNQALDAYQQAAGAASQEADRILLQLRRARVQENAGRYMHALQLYHRALTAAEALEPGPARERCRGRAHLGYSSVRLAQGASAGAVHQAGLAVQSARASGDLETLAHSYHLLSRAHADLGEHDAAARYRDLALPVFAELGDLPAQGTVLHDLGTDAQRVGRLEEALWFYERSHEVRMRAGDVVGAAASANAIGEVLLSEGRLAEASERFADALRAWRGAQYPHGVSIALANSGIVAMHAGDPAEACQRLEEAYLVASEVGSESLLEAVRIPLGDALLAAGRWVEAWQVATEGLNASADSTKAAAQRIRGEALLRTGGLARAREELQAAARVGDADEEEKIERLLGELQSQWPAAGS